MSRAKQACDVVLPQMSSSDGKERANHIANLPSQEGTGTKADHDAVRSDMHLCLVDGSPQPFLLRRDRREGREIMGAHEMFNCPLNGVPIVDLGNEESVGFAERGAPGSTPDDVAVLSPQGAMSRIEM